MGLEQVAKCDVFGTYKDVKPIRVLIQSDGEPVTRDREWTAYLSPRARIRLNRFIERGLVSVAKWKELNEERNDAK